MKYKKSFIKYLGSNQAMKKILKLSQIFYSKFYGCLRLILKWYIKNFINLEGKMRIKRILRSVRDLIFPWPMMKKIFYIFFGYKNVFIYETKYGFREYIFYGKKMPQDLCGYEPRHILQAIAKRYLVHGNKIFLTDIVYSHEKEYFNYKKEKRNVLI